MDRLAELLEMHGTNALDEARRQLHTAMAAGVTSDVDQLSAACFALIRLGAMVQERPA